MDALLQQLDTDPVGRLALRYVLQYGVANCVLFLLVAARLTGVLVLAPLFTANCIPVMVRGLLVVLVSLVVTPVLSAGHVAAGEIALASHVSGTAIPIPANITDFVCQIGCEVGFGTLLGVGVMAVFSGLRLAGELLDRHSGLGLAAMFNPEMGSGESAAGSVVHWMGIVAFLLIEPLGGQGLLLQSLLRSFHAIPVGSAVEASSLLDLLNGLVQQSLLLGLRLAMPLVAAMMLVDLTLSLASRGLPNLTSPLMVARTAVGLFVLGLTVTAIPDAIATTAVSVLQNFSF